MSRLLGFILLICLFPQLSNSQTQDTIFPFEKEFNGFHVVEYQVPLINRDEGSSYPILECGYCWQCNIRTKDTIPQKYEKYRIGIVNNQYGVFSEKGEEIIAPKYDSLYQVESIIQSIFIVIKDGKYGLVEEDNKIIFPPEYDEFSTLGWGIKCHHIGGLFYVRKGEKKGLLRVDGTAKVNVQYDYVNHNYNKRECPSVRPLVCVGLEGKYGFVNEDDSAVVPIIYEDIITRRPHRKYKDKIIAKLNGKYGVIDDSNSTIIPFKYDDIEFHYLDGYEMPFAVQLNNKWGLITSTDRPLFEPKFDSIQYLKYAANGKFAFLHNGKWGVADTNGNVVIKAAFSNIEALEGDYYIYSENGKKGFINNKGETLSEPIYDEIQEVHEYWALLKKGEYNGIFNMLSGKEIIPPTYIIPWHYYGEYDLHWSVYSYTNLMFWKDSTDNYGVIDSTGKIIVPFEYDQPFDIEKWQNRIIGTKESKKYLFDLDGHLIAGQLDQIIGDNYHPDPVYCIIQKDSLYGLISPENKIVLEPQYDRIEREYDRTEYGSDSIFFEVEKNGKVGIVNKNGVFIIPCEYGYIEYLDGKFNVVKGLKTATLLYDGTIAIPFDFNISEKLSTEYSIVNFGHQSAVIDQGGNRVDKGEYSSYKKLDNNYILARKNVKKKTGRYYEFRYGLLDTNMDVHLPAIYEDISFIRNDFGYIRDTNAQYYFYDLKNGIHEKKYVEIRYFPTGYFEVEESEYVEGICDTMGEIIIAPQFEKIKYYDKTWGAVKKNGLYGFCDGEGNIIVDYKYEKVKGVYKDYVTVRLNDKYGIVTRSGETVIPYKYNKSVKFDQLSSGHAFINVESEEGHGLLDSNMIEVVPSICTKPINEFKKIGDLEYIIVETKDGQSGVFLSSGENLVPIEQHQISDSFLTTTRLFKYKKNGKVGLINSEGEIVLKPKYDMIIGDMGTYGDNFNWNNPQPCLIYQNKNKFGLLSSQGEQITPAKYNMYTVSERGVLSVIKKSKVYVVNEQGKLVKVE